MIQLFDKYNLYETPSFILCNPDKSQLYSLGSIYDRKYMPRYNALSSISFTAAKTMDGIVNDYYSSLLYRKLVYVPNLGYFMITEVETEGDGILEEKKIVAQSLEVELSLKKLSLFKGTYKFYDLLTPSTTLIGTILTYLPGWTAGTIDTELTLLYRTFSVSDTTIYNFLMNEVEDAFQCIFVFDTIAKTISAHTISTAITETDIYMSYNNLLEKVSIKELTDELCTALNVYGGGNLSINQVNPLGTDTIYNFTYYKNTNWMSQALIDAVTAWEARILAKQQEYADTLTLLRSNNEELITLTGELVDLNSDMDALRQIVGARTTAGQGYSDVNILIASKQIEIDSKQAEIDSVNATIGIAVGGIYPEGTLNRILVDINTYVSFAENFTSTQLEELSSYILGNTYNNEHFIQTDLMTDVEIQDQAQALYDQAVTVLAKTSVPRYEFSVDAVNFVFLEEFQAFITQLVLGASITLELESGIYIYPVLLGLDLNYDDPTEFSMIFGNRMRLDDSTYIFSDLFGQAVKQGITTSFNSEQWGSWTNNYQDDVSTFITSALDASVNNVISGSSQNIIMDQTGIRGRSEISTGIYDPEQFWFIHNMLAFTQNNWQTSSLALGKISTTSGSAYGLVTDRIISTTIKGGRK